MRNHIGFDSDSQTHCADMWLLFKHFVLLRSFGKSPKTMFVKENGRI